MRIAQCLLAVAGIMVISGGLAGADPIGPDPLTEITTRLRQMNPALQVSRWEAAAAAAKAEGADGLPDPKLQLQTQNWKRATPGYLPSSSPEGSTKSLVLSQELPLWGKRDLRRGIAEDNAHKAQQMQKAVELELIAQARTAYADLVLAVQSEAQAKALASRIATLIDLARARYAQGRGSLPDVTRASVEKSMLETDIRQRTALRRKAEARLSALLDGPPPHLPSAPDFPPLPPVMAFDLAALQDQALSNNPELKAAMAESGGADQAVTLAEKAWTPDIEVGGGVMRGGGQPTSYQAMITVSLPLRWGIKEAELGEAKAMAAAAQRRHAARKNDLLAAVNDAKQTFDAARDTERRLQETTLREAELGFESAFHAYKLGRGDFTDVLSAEQQLWRTRLDLIAARAEQQKAAADLEKITGGTP